MAVGGRAGVACTQDARRWLLLLLPLLVGLAAARTDQQQQQRDAARCTCILGRRAGARMRFMIGACMHAPSYAARALEESIWDGASVLLAAGDDLLGLCSTVAYVIMRMRL